MILMLVPAVRAMPAYPIRLQKLTLQPGQVALVRTLVGGTTQ